MSVLTAEQVRKAIEEAKAELLESCEYVGDMGQRKSDVLRAFGKMEQAIADELNAELGSGTCENVHGHCSECGAIMYDAPNYCQNCGARVVARRYTPSSGATIWTNGERTRWTGGEGGDD